MRPIHGAPTPRDEAEFPAQRIIVLKAAIIVSATFITVVALLMLFQL